MVQWFIFLPQYSSRSVLDVLNQLNFVVAISEVLVLHFSAREQNTVGKHLKRQQMPQSHTADKNNNNNLKINTKPGLSSFQKCAPPKQSILNFGTVARICKK